MDIEDYLNNLEGNLSGFDENELFLSSEYPPGSSGNESWENSTKIGSIFSSFYFYEFEQLTFLWVLLCMIVIGNSAVLGAIILAKSQHKTRMNFFIMHLALADLSVGLINVLTDIIWKMTISFYMGNVACKLVKYFQTVVLYSSNYVLVALSIDRYYAITHPLKFSGSWRRARMLVASAWFLSFLFASPAFIIFHEEVVETVPQCWLQYINDRIFMRVYITVCFTALYVLPAIIIAVCYTIMVKNIWSQSRILTPQGKKATNSNGILRKTLRGSAPAPVVDEDDYSRRASSRGLIPKAKIKSVKMTFVIVFVFIMCASPYVVCTLLDVYDVFPITQTKVAMSTFFHSLSPINSAANPIIYCLFSTHICRNLRKIPCINWLVSKLCPRFGKSSPTANRRRFGPQGGHHGQDTMSQKTSTHFTSLTDSLIKSTIGSRSSSNSRSTGQQNAKTVSYPTANNKEVRFEGGVVGGISSGS